MPDVPVLADTLPGSEASTWYELGAPTNMPAMIVDRLNREINASLANSKMKEKLADLGGTVLGGSAAEFGTFVAAEIDKWGKVIRAASVKPE